MDWMHMAIRVAIIFVALLVLSGCKPSDEVDIFDFSDISNVVNARRELKNIFGNLPDENIYPYKPKEGCSVKRLDKNQIFFCANNESLMVGAAINPGHVDQNRQAFLKLVAAFKDSMSKKEIMYKANYRKAISMEEFKKMELYRK